MTPFGVPVEPDVYCRKAKVSALIAGCCQESSIPCVKLSVVSQCKFPRLVFCTSIDSNVGSITVVVRAMLACVCVLIACILGILRKF